MRVCARHIVPGGTPRVRFREYACSVFTLLPSRKAVVKAIKRGGFTIDGAAASTGSWVSPGQVIEFLDPDTPAAPTYSLRLRVLFEDEHVAVVEKPAGVVVNGNRFRTLEHALPYNLSASRERDALSAPRPVHRLDGPTGGLLLAAKTARAMVALGRQFEERAVDKRYRAVVMGQLEGEGLIDAPVDGRQAVTAYRAVRGAPSLRSGRLTLLDLWPGTGRTHQLRRHLAGAGFPILGDAAYGPPGRVLRGKGLFLAAVELSFEHPLSGERLGFTMDDPPKFASLLEREERRWRAYNEST